MISAYISQINAYIIKILHFVTYISQNVSSCFCRYLLTYITKQKFVNYYSCKFFVIYLLNLTCFSEVIVQKNKLFFFYLQYLPRAYCVQMASQPTPGSVFMQERKHRFDNVRERLTEKSPV